MVGTEVTLVERPPSKSGRVGMKTLQLRVDCEVWEGKDKPCLLGSAWG